ncbi:MAG: bifunctional diaminohydroxyphosphoribosylaminopyrimidine deaminase/5-amino-6-(5-phosphoribosylamino)uracil reductase RibD [Candidatus Peribacteraceae bacterium]|nr:bifunctional diaminohydroxyphosphoribosylaminopyrimidine deaminase/5-amino-6-(5-phosphoribosylamino)uracil reductase RibD [Candidatus Peribacteraceae bacterium]
MRRAIALAEKAINPSPNPRVGAVILKNGKIVGEGWHEYAGGPHAEIVALKKAGSRAQGGELFVTLEPCNRFGRTPPCSQAILNSGIKRVVIGVLDPTASGGGAKFLKKHGVEVVSRILEPACRELNKIWLKNMEHKRPFVTLKMALDAKGSTIPATSKKWISSSKSRREVMKLRRSFDAIAIGVGTITADNPRLTVRGIKTDRQPVRIIFDPNLRSPVMSKIFHDGGETILISRQEFPNYNLRKILQKLFQRGICSILLEGGETTAKKFLQAKLVDEIFIFQKGNRRKQKNWHGISMKNIGEFGDDGLFYAVP